MSARPASYPQRKPLRAPDNVHPALARLVEALARQAARDDYERHRGGENNNEESGDIRPLLQRPSD